MSAFQKMLPKNKYGVSLDFEHFSVFEICHCVLFNVMIRSRFITEPFLRIILDKYLVYC